MEAVLSVMKFERMRMKEGCMLGRSILCLGTSCQTLSKALETSRRIVFVVCLFCCACKKANNTDRFCVVGVCRILRNMSQGIVCR